jgi:hypothetical protein
MKSRLTGTVVIMSKFAVISNIKQLSKQYIRKIRNDQFCEIVFSRCFHINCHVNDLKSEKILDIASIAFNNETVIQHQIKLLEQKLADPYQLTIIDNSSDRQKSNKIRDVCVKCESPYIRLPQNPYNGVCPSTSHALALNWTYRNFLKRRNPCFFGFLDHDIFPVKNTSIIEYLIMQPIYGHLQQREEIWYLWPGFCFFNNEKICNDLNFLPENGLDTGGANWKKCFGKLKREQIVFPEHGYIKIGESDLLQDSSIEYIGDWIHLFNSSNWMGTQNNVEKFEIVMKKIQSFRREI